MNKHFVLLAAASLLSGAASAAPLGSDIGRDPDGAFHSDDSLEEAKNAKNALFTALDSNNDGVLDRKEVEIERTLRNYFDEADSDGDGKITREEYLRYQEAQKTPGGNP